jgi:tyrosine-protein kinase Etk/Wzc
MTKNNKQAQEDFFGPRNQIDFKFLTSKLANNWYWFIVSVFLCLLLAFLYLRYATPVYQTTTKIIITNDKKTGTGEDAALAEALGGQFGTANNAEGEAEILKTRNIMNKVVRDLKAYITYYDKGQIRSVDLYKSSPFVLRLLESPDNLKAVSLDVTLTGNKVHLYNDKFDKKVNLYQQFVIPGLGKVLIEKGTEDADPDKIYTVKVSTIRQTTNAFLGNLTVTIPIKQVNILVLDFIYQVPDKSEDILNKLIESYVQGNITDKNTIADSTIAFIENRLLFVGKELGSIEGNVQTFKQRNKLTDLALQSSQLVTSTADYMEQLAKVETQVSVLNDIEKYVTDANTNERIVPNGALLEDPGFAALVQRYNIIVLEKERSSVSRTEDNPYMQNLNVQISSARKDMLSSLTNLKKSLLIAKQKIQGRSNTIEGQVRNVPAVERTYLDLSRQQQIKQELYIFLLQKREETAISKTSNISNCKIIESPVTFGPISPQRMNVLGYGFILGAFIPFGIIFLKDRLNRRIISKEQVSTLVQAPVIGEIGNSKTGDAIAVSQSSRTAISEQFRALRTNLDFFLGDNEKTILLTSSMGGEGKSFVSLNLAAVLAISGKKVVVMELDLRKPNLSKKLNLANRFGFTNYIVSKEVMPKDILTPSATHENLFIIGSGVVPPNPAEIILNERTGQLMKYLREEFDYIIIDAPPVGIVTDAQLLSKYADLTLYVVRQGYTLKDQMEIPQEIFVGQKMKRISILLNDVKDGARYGSRYGYGYYDAEPENDSLFSRIGRKFRRNKENI